MKKLLLIILAITLITRASMSQVAINNNGSLPDSSAMLDVKSADKGILVPRMSSANRDAISNPAKGLLIFCTDDNNFYVNRGTSSSPDWTPMNSYWATNGTDLYYTGGNVGIGTMNPTARLDVRGSNPDDGTIFQIGNSDLSHRLMLFGGRENDPNPFIQWKQGDPLRFTTDEDGWSEKMRITGDGKVGIGITAPLAVLDIAGGNNWDLTNGEGDFRLGNSQYRVKMGIALGGGGAGDAGIMQYGQPGGYNVLSLGAQGNKLIFINGESQRVGIGIGTDSPMATLDIQGSLRVSDGTEGAGLVLTSDGDGIASWARATTSCIDYDGNAYPTFTIGTQVWMAENLRVTHYQNGDAIPNVTNNVAWEVLTTGAYCWYANNQPTNAKYGILYNWNAVDDNRGLCPGGWHVSTDAEWTTLTTYLGGESVAGGKMKSVSALWNPGFTNVDATNNSGFSGLPGGGRDKFGGFHDISNYGTWWSSSENDSYVAWNRSLSRSDPVVVRFDGDKNYGFSVRCLRDY